MTRPGHAARDNGLRYWAALTGGTISYYVKQRRWAALLRAAWLTIARGYYLEICQECGRKVGAVWHADDDLYEAVTHAHGAGVYCRDCFERLAEQVFGGCYVKWIPVLWSDGQPAPGAHERAS